METPIKRLIIRMPADWIDAIKRRAIEEGNTLTDYVSERLLSDVPKAKRNKLSERVYKPKGRPMKFYGGDE